MTESDTMKKENLFIISIGQKMEKTNVKPFGMKDKLGYMFGDFANDFTFILSSMMLMKL